MSSCGLPSDSWDSASSVAVALSLARRRSDCKYSSVISSSESLEVSLSDSDVVLALEEDSDSDSGSENSRVGVRHATQKVKG